MHYVKLYTTYLRCFLVVYKKSVKINKKKHRILRPTFNTQWILEKYNAIIVMVNENKILV